MQCANFSDAVADAAARRLNKYTGDTAKLLANVFGVSAGHGVLIGKVLNSRMHNGDKSKVFLCHFLWVDE